MSTAEICTRERQSVAHVMHIQWVATDGWVRIPTVHACAPAGLEEILDRQHLFSVYVHLPPNMTLSGPRSVFHGRCDTRALQ